MKRKKRTGLLRNRHSKQLPILRVTLKDLWPVGSNFLLRLTFVNAPGVVSKTVMQASNEAGLVEMDSTSVICVFANVEGEVISFCVRVLVAEGLQCLVGIG
jgi:hypothetical protein